MHHICTGDAAQTKTASLQSKTRADKYIGLYETQCCDSQTFPSSSQSRTRCSAWFSTMDLQDGYWHVELEETDHEKYSRDFFFTHASGTHQHYSQMPQLMEMVLHGLPWKTCPVYLDSVHISSCPFSQHLQHLEELPSRFQCLKLNPSKCCLVRHQPAVSKSQVSLLQAEQHK